MGDFRRNKEQNVAIRDQIATLFSDLPSDATDRIDALQALKSAFDKAILREEHGTSSTPEFGS